ncbi:MAG: hypothetical protein A2937_03520 [Candidatus Yonathbacteria bacterium RIFCSPLOWO2_01_FULL_47_33b]|uniref:RNA polymerase sigma factor 70 region 4 type 2 domain-containing protein n=1 Tax=Candidatus Yonathbacteria bacterium RIFCSPLOWO2_01_FULL_47_33b TaxID=1802727 RepID=A0A1G2SFE1_9BACT|nr:MAG: hypothetical protein A2937_03520 [Candidatus Yonathbacteria bacterium RIFCSPLOWO2_01_FULL_47_33b]
MVTTDDKKLNLVKQLYSQEQYSMREVGEKLDMSLDAVVYFMRKHNLKRRTLKEESVLRFRNKPLSYCLQENLTTEQEKLKMVGVALYWGEGYKTEKSSGIDLANSDVSMVLVFLCFLREICGIDEKRLRVLLYCYSNQDSKKLMNFWSKVTKIPMKQFTKPYVRKDFNPAMLDKMPYGMIHIRYSDKKLLAVVKKWIGDIKIRYA